MEPVAIDIHNKSDREAVAMALFRAGYTVRERRRKEGTKTMISDREREDGIFTIQARRCKRCGGLLTSKKGIQYGYGPDRKSVV